METSYTYNQQTSFPIYKDSWRVLSPNVFIKAIDGTTFKHNSTRIPRELRPFFQIDDMAPGDRRKASFAYKGEKYSAVIDMDIQSPPRTAISWRTDFYNVLKKTIPKWDAYFILNNRAENPPLLRLEKTKDQDVFIVDIIDPSTVERDCLPEEEGGKLVYEGKPGYFYSKKYERKPENRRRAIEIHGLTCVICKFDFQMHYGDRGEGFIEIHHTKPLNSFDEEVVVNPVTDLIPVCSNCHRMIHRKRDEVLTIEEMIVIYRK